MIKLGWYSLPLPCLPSYEVSCWHCSPKLFSRNILIKARPGCCPGTESTCIWQTDIQEGRTCRASVLSRDTWYPLLDQLNGSLLWTPDPRPAEDHQDFISCFLVYLVLDSDLILAYQTLSTRTIVSNIQARSPQTIQLIEWQLYFFSTQVTDEELITTLSVYQVKIHFIFQSVSCLPPINNVFPPHLSPCWMCKTLEIAETGYLKCSRLPQ